MRIIYLHQYFNTHEMAGGSRSYEMAKRLVSYGHEVHMITSWREQKHQKGWHVTNEDGINVYWYPVAYSNHMSFIQRIKAFIKFSIVAARKAASIDADVIFATSTPLTIVLPAIYAMRKQKKPMVFEVRDLWPKVPIAMGVIKNKLLIKLALFLERLAYKKSRRIIALAPGMKAHICALGFDSNKIDIIPNGADVELFGCSKEKDVQKLEQKYSFLKDKKIIVYIGTLGLANGVQYIPKLAASMLYKEKYESVIFVVIGDGKSKDEIKKEASDLQVIDRTVFFIDAIPKQEVPVWLEKSEATIMTYDGPEIVYKDSVSNKYFDSLAAKKPVFANFTGFSTKIAKAHRAGVILSKENIDVAAQMLIQHVDDKEWMLRASKNAYLLAQKSFNREFLAKELECSLMRAAGQRPSNEFIIGSEFELLEKQAEHF